MPRPFFPDLIFGWVFYLVLVGFTAVASWSDFRRMRIPKWLTLPLLGTGVVLSIVRGAWCGAQGQRLWMLETGTWWMGAIDGLMFSLAGFGLAFGVMFLLWIMGTCGGGDVKLFAALSAALGPMLFIFVYLGSIAVLFVLFPIRIMMGGLRPSSVQKMMKAQRKPVGASDEVKKPRLRLTYSFPVAVATTLVLLWVFRGELNLESPVQGNNESKVQANAR
jgi:Flp pilus assembly protein protease CpaA